MATIVHVPPPPMPPPYEVARYMHLWGIGGVPMTKNTLLKVGDRVMINHNFLRSGSFVSEKNHHKLSFQDMQEYYEKSKLVGMKFTIQSIHDRGDCDVIDLVGLVYAFNPLELEKIAVEDHN